MLSPNHVKDHTEYNCCSEKQTAPVHCHSCDDGSSWPEAEERSNKTVDDPDDIDDRPENWAHMPWTPMDVVFHGVVSKAFVQQ